ncbi:hypothetical protein [Nodosilinea nodulosa]|uniref:hypothetical protein n=1 Tax=Nodosilinea nodulosa TaxID=416001 RepID=UPI0002D350A1|nr:hypothetical protein [Nodosilinea nodulosa]
MVAYILPSDEAEEWLGDLLEVNRELIESELPFWQINVISMLRIIQLVWAAYKVTWSDFINTNWDE